jgi:hypothetical protein
LRVPHRPGSRPLWMKQDVGRCPGGSRDPCCRRSCGREVDPGFRRGSVLYRLPSGTVLFLARSRRRRSNLDRGWYRRPEIASLRQQETIRFPMAADTTRFPGGSRDLLPGRTSGGNMGPGFRRDSVPGPVSSRGVGCPAGVELAMTISRSNFFLAIEPGVFHPPKVVRAVDPDRDSLNLWI